MAIQALCFLQFAQFEYFRVDFAQVLAKLLIKSLFSLCCDKFVGIEFSELAEVRVKASCLWLKFAVNLVIDRHEDTRHLMLVVISIEDSRASGRGLGGFIARISCRQRDFFVVSFSIAGNHKGRWKFP